MNKRDRRCVICGDTDLQHHHTLSAGFLTDKADKLQQQQARIAELEKQIISFDMIEGFPRHHQGWTHEIQELLTAADCDAMVDKIYQLQLKIKELESGEDLMKINAMVNVGLLLDAMHRKGFAGIEEAAAVCRVAPLAFKQLLDYKGEAPRVDALFRICQGLGITMKELFIPCQAISGHERTEEASTIS